MNPNTISIDGQLYTRSPEAPTGNRHIVVLDRGWIGIGHRTVSEDGKTISLTECHNLRRWDSGGFGGATIDPKGSGVEMDAMADIRYAPSAEIFIVPIPEDWNE